MDRQKFKKLISKANMSYLKHCNDCDTIHEVLLPMIYPDLLTDGSQVFMQTDGLVFEFQSKNIPVIWLFDLYEKLNRPLTLMDLKTISI